MFEPMISTRKQGAIAKALSLGRKEGKRSNYLIFNEKEIFLYHHVTVVVKAGGREVGVQDGGCFKILKTRTSQQLTRHL